MPINRDAVPYYVVLISEHEKYKLNEARRILGEPSDDLIAFARQNGVNISVDTTAWNQFAKDAALSPVERERHCCYILVHGEQTEEDLQRLMDL